MNRLGILILVLFSVSCNDTLETGYTPSKLGASDATRRGYYAEPFSADAHAASQEKREEAQQRKPGAY